MNRLQRKVTQRVLSAQQPSAANDCETKLQNIIKTFRQNNLKLLHQIEECDKKREGEFRTNKKMHSEKYIIEKYGQQQIRPIDSPEKTNRSQKQLKQQPCIFKTLKSDSKKQNLVQQLAFKYISKPDIQREMMQQVQTDSKLRVVKIKPQRLVPLSIDKLRQKMKML